MDKETNDDPVKKLLLAHTKTKQYLDLIKSAAQGQAIDAYMLTEVKDWFNKKEKQINQLLSEVLFPNLLEAMAGSDAICIKGMTGNFVQSNKKLNSQWQTEVLPFLENKNIKTNNIGLWAESYAENLLLCDDEIIPMAERLLDANAYQILSDECNKVLSL